MAKLCMYNDCHAGEHEYSIRCCDCPDTDCPERCPNKNCESCYWMTEVRDDERRTQKQNG